MKFVVTLSFAISSLAVFAAPASAQFIVQDGDNLQSVVSAAPSGSVVEIQSNGTFTGSVVWGGKDLVLRAGVGFTPTIQGHVGISTGIGPATNTLAGLKIRGMLDLSSASAVGSAADFDVSDCEVVGMLLVSASNAGSCDVDLLRTTARGSFGAEARVDAVARIRATDCGFARNFFVQAVQNASAHVTLQRSRINLTLGAFDGSNGVVGLDVESCLLVGKGFSSTPGVDLGTDVVARLVNTTIYGYGVGLRGGPSVSGENLMIFGSAMADMGPGILGSQIANSLIEDGTFAGQNGNFGGTPVVGPDFRLQPGSIGIDAGNNTALGIGTRDFYGAARIQDGDGNGSSLVDVGAVEL
ncbi:MAG: hypothetical protein HZA52_11940 [Planctomycetes bacterium]|nr:hypothetical protein [Planctomycetota bacterium]